MSGFGAQPFGSSSFGLGTPSSAPAPSGAVLRNPDTGAQTGSRRIDPLTRDYVVDSVTGRSLAMGDVQQMVYLAIANIDFSEFDVIADDFERRMRLTLEGALADLVRRKLVAIVSVETSQLHPGAARPRLRWRDLSADIERTTEL